MKESLAKEHITLAAQCLTKKDRSALEDCVANMLVQWFEAAARANELAKLYRQAKADHMESEKTEFGPGKGPTGTAVREEGRGNAAVEPPSKYHVQIGGVWLDVYDVINAYAVTNPGDQHAIKKILMPGKRGVKDANQDRSEAIQSLERAIEIEDRAAGA